MFRVEKISLLRGAETEGIFKDIMGSVRKSKVGVSKGREKEYSVRDKLSYGSENGRKLV